VSGGVATADFVAAAIAGDRRAIARLISRFESGGEDCAAAQAEIYRRAGRAHIVGITGVPGSGKSTLVKSLVRELRQAGRSVGIVAIDPTSPFSGGSILGDRIRMNEIAGDPGVFIRSMATRGALGGLSATALDAVDVLDAAGFDMVIIETVGVGQDEVDIVTVAHTTVVVSAPGLGDDIQAIKAGILEIADIHVVSKADRPDANRTVRELKTMLTHDVHRHEARGWHPPVVATSAETGEGIAALNAAIAGHRAALAQSGEFARRGRRIAEVRILREVDRLVRRRFGDADGPALQRLVERVAVRDLDPHAAAAELLPPR
jgi:LAO/AO transport system kinase